MADEKMVKFIVDEAYLEANPDSGVELGAELERPETDEEREAREKHEKEVADDEANAARDAAAGGATQDGGESATGESEVNGARHPLA